MRIPSNPEIEEIAHCFISTAYRDHPLPCQAPQHLGDLKI